MKVLVAVGLFFVALVFGAPFWGALLLAVLAWLFIHFAVRQDEALKGAHRPAQRASSYPPAAAAQPRPQQDEVPDGADPGQLRAYLRKLTHRIHALEQDIAALRGQRVAEAAPVVAPPPAVEVPPSAPVETAWQEFERTNKAPEPPQAAPASPEPVSRAPEPQAPMPTPAPAATEAAPPMPEPSPVAAKAAMQMPRQEARLQRQPEPYRQRSGGEAPPARPPQPEGPSFFARLVSGNIVAKVGAIVLFFGVGFLLKFAYDRDMISPQLRLLGVAAAAVAVFFAGWRLREGERRLYGLILQGVASGLAYLDVFFALKTYQFISVPLGFSLFALLGVMTTLLAVRQDAKALAVLGLTGAFLAPVLASTDSGNHVFLFTYYLLLNVFVLAVSWFKSWRALNLTGWFFTLAVAAVWGARSYTPALFHTVEPFLLAFFAIYLVIPILFATRQPPELKGLVDGTLVFGTPAAVAAIQAQLVWDMPYGLAWSAAIGAALYAVLSVMVLRHQNMRLLGHTYVALALGLGTLAIFYAFGAYTTFALWSIEGAAIVWVCLRQNQMLGRLFGMAVQVAGAVYFALYYADYSRANPWFNDAVLGCAIIAAAAFITASLLRRYRETITEFEGVLGSLVLLWGAAWWSAGGIDAIFHGVETAQVRPAVYSLYFSASVALAELAGAKAQWPMLRGLSVVHPFVLLTCGFLQASFHTQPLTDLGALAWPIGLGSLFWVLHRQRRDAFDAGFLLRYASAWLIFAWIATWQAVWHLEQHEYPYAMALALLGYLAAALRLRLREQDPAAARLSTLPMLWAMAFWFAGGLLWIHHDVLPVHQAAASIVFVSAHALLVEFIGVATSWPALRASSAVHPVMLLGAALLQFVTAEHPLADYGSPAWAMGLATLFYVLHRQRRDGVDVALALRYGAAWLLLGGIATWEALWQLREREYLYALVIALVGYAVAAMRWRISEHGTDRTRVSTAVFLWSMALWFGSFGAWAHDSLSGRSAMVHAFLLCVALSAALYELGAQWLEWPVLRTAARLPWLAIPGALLLDAGLRAHPLSGAWGLAWPVAWLLALWGLRREERETVHFATGYRHLVALYSLIAVATWELVWRLADWQLGEAWRNAAFALPASAVLLALVAARDTERWPLEPNWPLYRDYLLVPVVAGLALWALLVNLRPPGGLEPLRGYVPLLNPVDASIALAACAVTFWGKSLEDEQNRSFLWKILALLGFLWLNAVALRTIHYWADVPYRFEPLMHSVLVQATLSILWTSAALALMLLAGRRMERKLWVAGGALLLLVVAKLFVVDLANTGTVARIVSFLGVGVLLLVIGYLAPVPPGAKESESGG